MDWAVRETGHVCDVLAQMPSRAMTVGNVDQISNNALIIASQRVRAKRGPMTGSAKQSISP
jgi:hypothetical protein